MRLFGVILALAAAGCFPSDLGEGRISCGSNDSCPPDYVCRPDHRCYSPGYPFGTHPDMSVGDLGGGGGGGSDLAGQLPGDMTGQAMSDMASINNICSATISRVCVDPSHSATCVLNGGTWAPMLDRTCPPGSTCTLGYCQHPPNATACTVNTDCASMQVCDQYVSGSLLVGYCTAPPMTAQGSNRCMTPGYDNKCGTEICAGNTGNNKTACLNPCRSSADCMGRNCDPVATPGTIEGVSTSALHFCEAN